MALDVYLVLSAATQTSVMSLRDISAECVARSLQTLKDLKSLSLPHRVEELVKSVLNEKENFS